MKGIPHDEKYHDRIMKDQNHEGKMMIHQKINDGALLFGGLILF